MKENIFAFAATETGYNHIKVNKICEDASDFYDDDKMHICVVADGHGSDNYPRTERGSKYAVDAAIQCTVDFVNVANVEDVLTDEKYNYRMLIGLATSILGKWYQSVENDYRNNPFTEEELFKVSEKYKNRYLTENESERKIEKAYGCTLIMYVVTDSYSFGMQIGDGKCVVIDRDGSFTEPIPWDEDCQLNVTTSICDSDAIEEFRFSVSNKIPAAVFCGSDGIDDSYSNPEELYALYRSILKIFIEHGIETGQKEIKEYLPVLTKRGSGDDVSIGLIVDFGRAKEIATVFDIQSELFKIKEQLTEQYHQRDTAIEKDKALSLRVRKWLDSGKKSSNGMEDVRLINDEIRPQVEKLNEEIRINERKLKNLSNSLQEILYDVEVASFGEPRELDIREKIEPSEASDDEDEQQLSTIETNQVIATKENQTDIIADVADNTKPNENQMEDKTVSEENRPQQMIETMDFFRQSNEKKVITEEMVEVIKLSSQEEN